jgi:hypothetical protein
MRPVAASNAIILDEGVQSLTPGNRTARRRQEGVRCFVDGDPEAALRCRFPGGCGTRSGGPVQPVHRTSRRKPRKCRVRRARTADSGSAELPIRPKVGRPRAARNRCYTSRTAVAVVGLVTNGTVRSPPLQGRTARSTLWCRHCLTFEQRSPATTAPFAVAHATMSISPTTTQCSPRNPICDPRSGACPPPSFLSSAQLACEEFGELVCGLGGCRASGGLIAALGRWPSTISRELHRNTMSPPGYTLPTGPRSSAGHARRNRRC